MVPSPKQIYDFVIIHGSYGSPFENWFPWLFQELESKGYRVLAPQFPCDPKIQNYQNWAKVLDSYSPFLGSKTTFIGHSLAPAFIINYLLNKKMKVKGLYFIAPFYQKLNNPKFDEVNTPFFIRKNLRNISKLSQKRVCFISTNDPYVPNAASIDFAEKIDATIKIVQKAGHFNTSAGYQTFPALLQELIKD